jgi:F0F1-type ATP synthase assembly protein I
MGSPDRTEPSEEREVLVDEPQLSPAVNEALTDEVRDAVGRRRVEVPVARTQVSRGEPVDRTRVGWRPDKFMLVMISAAGIVVGAIIALLLDHWWVLIPVVLVLWLVTYAVVVTIMRMTSVTEHPSPETVAAMEEEGVADPDRHFDDLVREFTPEHPEGGDARTVSAEQDPARAAAEHRGAMTPSGGPSRPAGP